MAKDGGQKPKPEEPVGAKRNSRFIGELKIDDWYGRKKAQNTQK